MACNNELRENNKPYPRTCADCKLGPCHKLGSKPVQTLQEAQAEIARLHDELAELKTLLGMCDHSLHKAWSDAIDAAAQEADAHDAKKFNETYSVEHKRRRYDTHQVDRAVNHALNIQSEDVSAAIRALRKQP